MEVNKKDLSSFENLPGLNPAKFDLTIFFFKSKIAKSKSTVFTLIF